MSRTGMFNKMPSSFKKRIKLYYIDDYNPSIHERVNQTNYKTHLVNIMPYHAKNIHDVNYIK